MDSRAGWVVLLLVAALVTQDVHGISHKAVRGMLDNHRFMSGLFACLMNYRPCNNITQRIKDNAHDALHGRCRGCSRDEAQLVGWAIQTARHRYPKKFRQVWRRYY